jgi:LysE type translocator
MSLPRLRTPQPAAILNHVRILDLDATGPKGRRDDAADRDHLLRPPRLDRDPGIIGYAPKFGEAQMFSSLRRRMSLLDPNGGFWHAAGIGALQHLRLLLGLSHRIRRVTTAAAVGTALCVSATWWVSVVLFFASNLIRQAYRRARRWIDAVMGAVLIGLGVRLALSR